MRESDFVEYDLFKLIKIPEKSGLYEIRVNQYWIVSDDCEHIYKAKNGGWQCNADRRVLEYMTSKKEYPFKSFILLPVVFIPKRVVNNLVDSLNKNN